MTNRVHLSRRRVVKGACAALVVGAGGCTTAPISSFKNMTGLNEGGDFPSDLYQELEKSLFSVNKQFIYETDQNIYGQKDYWVVASKESAWRGDCEDHALLCKQLLAEKGIHKTNLLTCWTENNDYHCVLYVSGWILDVRFKHVMSNVELRDYGYRWHKIGLEGGRWFYVDPVV